MYICANKCTGEVEPTHSGVQHVQFVAWSFYHLKKHALNIDRGAGNDGRGCGREAKGDGGI